MVDLPIPPQMGLHAIPEAEHPAAEKVRHHLFELLSFAELFKEDLRLYDYCNRTLSGCTSTRRRTD